MKSQLQRDKENVLRTLFFCIEARWSDLEQWTRPRLNVLRLGEAIGSLVEEQRIIVERRKWANGRSVQFIRLREWFEDDEQTMFDKEDSDEDR